MTETLPFVDEYVVKVAGDSAQVWDSLRQYVRSMRFNPEGLLARALGTEPAEGFEVASEIPLEEIVLVGRHRFSSYRLTFRLGEPHGASVPVHAITHAAFPGAAGRAYRLLVISSRGHRLAVRHMLKRMRSASA